MQGILDSDLARLWAWTDNPVTTPAGGLGVVWTEDGSRSGARGMLLVDELEKSTNTSPSNCPSNCPSNSTNDNSGDAKVISKL